jgi:pimeloyl-CoA synthetase
MLRTFEVPEEKTIAAISAIQSTVLELENRKEKIHPDFVNKDLAKMKEIELQTKDELKKILGTEVRVEALLQHQREFLKQTLNRQPANQ